jgi:hypothetical protein
MRIEEIGTNLGCRGNRDLRYKGDYREWEVLRRDWLERGHKRWRSQLCRGYGKRVGEVG